MFWLLLRRPAGDSGGHAGLLSVCALRGALAAYLIWLYLNRQPAFPEASGLQPGSGLTREAGDGLHLPYAFQATQVQSKGF